MNWVQITIVSAIATAAPLVVLSAIAADAPKIYTFLELHQKVTPGLTRANVKEKLGTPAKEEPSGLYYLIVGKKPGATQLFKIEFDQWGKVKSGQPIKD